MSEVGGIDFNFDIFNPVVLDFVEKRSHDFWDEVNATTKENLRRVLKESVEKGWTITELVGHVQTDVFKNLTSFEEHTRARRIARTETTMALNQGADLAYEQSGVVPEKEWLTSNDSAVRATHKGAERQGAIKRDAKFSNGLKFPGDPSGAVKEIVNCRCSLLPVVSEEQVVEESTMEAVEAQSKLNIKSTATRKQIEKAMNELSKEEVYSKLKPLQRLGYGTLENALFDSDNKRFIAFGKKKNILGAISYYESGPDMIVNYLASHPLHMGGLEVPIANRIKGIGSSLMHEVIKEAYKKNLAIRLSPVSSSVSFYEKLGFVQPNNMGRMKLSASKIKKMVESGMIKDVTSLKLLDTLIRLEEDEKSIIVNKDKGKKEEV